jgi:hypothetical protein
MTVRTVAVLAASGLVLGLAGCGDDDDSDASDAPAAEDGDTAAFCDSVVEFNTAVFEVDLDEESTEEEIKAAGADVGPLMQAVVDSAPEGLQATAEELNDAVQPLNDGDAGPFNADDTFDKYNAFASDAIEECDFEQVDVTAVDYAFEDVPARITAGTVAFSMANASETEEHEMVIFRKGDGEELSIPELLELPEEETEERIVFKSAAFAPPGESGSTLASLDPGEYGMVCFIPVGGAEDGAPHFTQGMLQEFVVE